MLAETESTLKQFSPKVSICTYHLPDDPPVITESLRAANAEYVLTNKWKKIYGLVPGKM